MEKPIEIINLEKAYQIELTEFNQNENLFSKRNTYQLNKNGDVVALNLSYNQITEIKNLEDLKHLSYLDLSDNQITEIKNLEDLKQLSLLDLSDNQITEIKNLEEIKQLSILDLSFNQITEIKNLEDLKQLSKLDLSDNQITELKNLEDLKHLSELNLSSNQITEIKNLEDLKHLSYLHLSDNQITEIKNLEDLKHLSYLHLSDNQITEIKNLEDLKQLSYLNLYSNQIAEIKNLEDLKQLSYLNLYSNQITEIKNLEELKQLSKLNLSSNQITEIKNLEELKQLSKLNLSSNQITEIEKLEAFIKILPIRMTKYFFSNGINLYGNPMDELLINYLTIENEEERKIQLIHYFKNLKIGVKPLREAKLMILGEGESGKTNLRNYFLGKSFYTGKSATTGINIDPWTENIDDENYRINIWDFGGQWIQQQVHQFFLTNESIFVLLLNARQDEKPEKWLDWIKNYAPDSKVFVVANKMDENPNFKIEENTLKEEYSFIKGFAYISLLNAHKGIEEDNVKIKKLIEDVKNQVFNLKGINSNVAKNIHDLKKELEDEYLSYKPSLSYDTFMCNLYEKHNVMGNPESLLENLEKIGTLRFFKAFDRLILSPEWLSGGVYKILMSKIANDKLGVIDDADIKEVILHKENPEEQLYRESDIPFIKKLMEEFKIAYFKDNLTFIPSQFQEDIPKEIKLKEIEENYTLKFYFEFDTYFPELLISKFIVDFFPKVKDELFWKTGIVLKSCDNDLRKETIATIISHKKQRRIFIYMEGEEIRPFFKDIHENILNYLNKTEFQYDEVIVDKENNIPLNYRELLILFTEGKRFKQAFLKGKSIDIDVKDALGIVNKDADLETLRLQLENMKNEKHINIVETQFIIEEAQGNLIGGKYNTQNNYTNNYANNPNLLKVESILREFDQLKIENDTWKNIFVEALQDVIDLKEAESIEEEKESKNKLNKVLDFVLDVGKKTKEWKDLVFLPVDFQDKVPKLVELADNISKLIP